MTDISEKDIQVVRKWLDGGCPSWAVPVDQIRKLCSALAALEAENERLRNMLDGYGKLDAELAIAERRIEDLSRTGAVKVEGPRRCATEGCDQPATNEFIRGDVGSFYCGDCFGKVIEACETLTRPSEQAVTEAMVEAALKAFHSVGRYASEKARMKAALTAAQEDGR